MAEGNKLFGGGKSTDSNAPETTDAQANATETTTATDNAAVTDSEAKQLDGAGGPNVTPAFGKQDFRDENVPLTDTDDLQSLKSGAEAQSAPPGVDLAALEAAALAGNVPEGEEDKTQYTSTPIASFRLGRFQFENGLLSLNSKDAGEFEKLLSGASPRDQATIRKIDRNRGEAIARKFSELHGSATQGIDTTSNGTPSPTPRAEG